MKLIVQIPCFNEEETLSQTIQDIPRQIAGISNVEILVIDDGSTDKTMAVAKENGVDHIISHFSNKGLAHTFTAGLDACLRLGADIIVNTDADNQYCGEDIKKIVKPILCGEAEIVVGDRQTDTIEHFSRLKKILQKTGSYIARFLSDTEVADAVSGFRAFSKSAALDLNVVSDFSYTIETLIQAGRKKISVKSVPVRTNPEIRPSRLFKSLPQFLASQAGTMLRTYIMYKPLRIFFLIGGLFILVGVFPTVRFLIFYFEGQGNGHVQSLIFASIFFIMGFQIIILGVLGDVLSLNRKLTENILLKVKRIELNLLKNQKKDK